MRKRGRRGTAMIEFALLTPFWVALLLGTLQVGTRMIVNLQTIQVARDTASMYARGVTFDGAANRQLVARLGQELGLKVSGGNGVVILSTVKFIGPKQCNGCTNLNKWVFTQRTKFGQTGLRDSSWGDPAPCGLDEKGNVSADKMLGDTCAQVKNFNLLGTPSDDAPGIKPGQEAYISEVYVDTAWGAKSYAYAIF
ncbi:MAG: TadE family protein [Acidobacteriota bacterium]